MTFSWDILFHPLHLSSPLYWNKPLIQRGKKKRIRIDPSTQEKPYLKAFQHFVMNPKCWRSERQLHRERYPLERWPAPRLPHPPPHGRHPLVPGFHCLFSLSPLSALLFNSRNEFHTHPPRARCPVTLPRRRFMCQCPERSGWRKTRSACPRTCVSVRASWMDGGWMEWVDGQTVNQKGQPHGPREAGLQARAGGTLWDGFPTVSRNSASFASRRPIPQNGFENCEIPRFLVFRCFSVRWSQLWLWQGYYRFHWISQEARWTLGGESVFLKFTLLPLLCLHCP